MIVVDTSAIVAILFGDPGSADLERQLLAEPCIMTAATRVELGIVIEAKTGPTGAQLLDELLDRVGMQIAAVDSELARLALAGWRRFGKGRHPAGLNLGDAFSYALAQQLGQPLLYVGDDFSRTDLVAAQG